MSARLLLLLLCGLAPLTALAFPPSPYHTVYGTVRDEHGRPLGTGEGQMVFRGTSTEIARTLSEAPGTDGINYTLRIPMDAGTSAQLYQVTAMRPLLPFTIAVRIGSTEYVPLQIVGKTWTIGKPGAKTRLDLTLGVDTNHDGLPDAWQQAVVDADKTGRLHTINDVRPGDDLSGNGLTNWEKFISGVNALDKLDGIKIEVVDWAAGVVHLRFLAVVGRTYTVRSSTDTVHWAVQPFSIDSAGALTHTTYRPEGLQVVDAYAVWPTKDHGYFQLFAQ